MPALAAGGSTVAKLSITTAQTLQAGAGNCAGASATCSATQFQIQQGAPENVTVQLHLRLWRHFRRRLVADKSRRRLDLDRRGRVSALTPVTTAYTPTDGTLAANTAKDGVLGNWYRVKYTTVATYAGGTTLTVDVVSTRGRVQ